MADEKQRPNNYLTTPSEQSIEHQPVLVTEEDAFERAPDADLEQFQSTPQAVRTGPFAHSTEMRRPMLTQ